MHNLMLMRILKGITQLSHQWPQVFPCKQMAGLLQTKGGEVLSVHIF